MEFIEFETSEADQQNEDTVFSDDENKDNGKTDENFVDDNKQPGKSDLSFYRKFANQTKDSRFAIYDESDDEAFLDTRDLQLELYAIEYRESATFAESSGYKRFVEKFKKSLSSFTGTGNENSFFEAIIFGLMFRLTERKLTSKDKVESVLGVDLYKDFCEVKDQMWLDTSIYGFFDKCALANEFLTIKISF